MQPIVQSFTPSDNDADGFANDVAGTSGVAFVLAATTIGDGLAHKVIITPSGAVTGNYTISGTDADDKTISETLATDAANAVTSAKYYKTLTSVIAPSGIGANTVDIGWTDVAVGPMIPLDTRQANFNVAVAAIVTGTISVTAQSCSQPVFVSDPSALIWFPLSAITAAVANTQGSYTTPVTATRLLINSLTAGATVKYAVSQSGV